jgi:GMP synthase-like glutamine amidotransferase
VGVGQRLPFQFHPEFSDRTALEVVERGQLTKALNAADNAATNPGIERAFIE